MRRSLMARLVLLGLVLLPATAPAANIAVYGEIDPVPLEAQGHTVTVLTLAQLEAGDIGGYDILLLGHVFGDPGWSSAACSSVRSFLSGGGGLIAEWNAVYLLFSGTGPKPWMPVTPQCALFPGTAAGGDVLAFGTPITISDARSPLVLGLDDGFDMGDGSESFVTISGISERWLVAATFDAASGPAPAILASQYGQGGWVVAATMDLFDAFGWGGAREANASTLLANLVEAALGNAHFRRPVDRISDRRVPSRP